MYSYNCICVYLNNTKKNVVFGYVCMCVFVQLCICVLVYLCVCEFVYLLVYFHIFKHSCNIECSCLSNCVFACCGIYVIVCLRISKMTDWFIHFIVPQAERLVRRVAAQP